MSVRAAFPLLLLASACQLFPSAALAPPSRASARVGSIDVEGANLVVEIAVETPANTSGRVVEHQWQAWVEGAAVASGSDALPVELPAGATTIVPARVRFSSRAAEAAEPSLAGRSSAQVTIRGALRATLSDGDVRVPYDVTVVVPMLRPLGAEIVDVLPPELDGPDAHVTLVADLRNPNAFRIELSKAVFVLHLATREVGEVTPTEPVTLAPGEIRRLRLAGTLPPLDVLSGLFSGRGRETARLRAAGVLRTPHGEVNLPR